MFSEPIRHKAMERARHLGVAALSSKVRLMQETSTDIQPGVLLYLPVFRKEMPLDTTAQREHAFMGWVFSPFRLGDLITDTLGESESRIHIRIFDALIETPDIVTITARQECIDEIPTWAVELKDGTHIPLNDDPAYEALVEQLDELDHQILMNTPWLTGAYAIQDTMVVDRQTGTVGEVSFNVAAIGKDILEEDSP